MACSSPVDGHLSCRGVSSSEESLHERRVTYYLDVVLKADGNDVDLDRSEDEVVAELVASNFHATFKGFFELVCTEVTHTDMLDLTSFLQSFKCFECTSSRGH